MKQFVVIGLGRFGSSVAKALYSMDHEVLAIDKDEEKVQEISDYVTHAVQADATDENVLKSLGIRNFDELSYYLIRHTLQHPNNLLCKEIGVKYAIAKAQSELHSKVLYKIEADKVVFPERDMAMRVVHNSSFIKYIGLCRSNPEYSLVEIEALPHWQVILYKELNIRGKYGINVLAIKHEKEINVAPNGDDIINKDDILVVIGKTKDITRLENKYQTQRGQNKVSEIITSPNNPTIKLVKVPPYKEIQDQYGLYFVEGWKMVKEAIAENCPIHILIYSEDFDIHKLELDKNKG